ncbi:MAG TPA: amidase, partial [Pseudomonas sp.]|nr:amidase [Pseudomonas sp.]
MSDATSMAEAFASGRSDPVQALEQALDQASRCPGVFISLTAERARREAEAAAAR